jgi:anti-sigma regulatory factor (Ser/Thr protein kinase)
MRTLFAYQRRMEERPRSTGVWVTGPVPLGNDAVEQSAWNRYESAVNEALSAYPFRAMCTYDTRTCPESVIAAARATHPTVSVNRTRAPSPEYVDPAAFLADPLALPPTPPTTSPITTTTITHPDALRAARHLLKAGARSHSAVCPQTIEQFLVAVHEVAANGLFHGRPPVEMALWAELGSLTCVVDDAGEGNLDPMTGYQFPGDTEPMGLWAARQLVDDLLIGDSPSGGCRVLLTMADGPVATLRSRPL